MSSRLKDVRTIATFHGLLAAQLLTNNQLTGKTAVMGHVTQCATTATDYSPIQTVLQKFRVLETAVQEFQVLRAAVQQFRARFVHQFNARQAMV